MALTESPFHGDAYDGARVSLAGKEPRKPALRNIGAHRPELRCAATRHFDCSVQLIGPQLGESLRDRLRLEAPFAQFGSQSGASEPLAVTQCAHERLGEPLVVEKPHPEETVDLGIDLVGVELSRPEEPTHLTD